WRFESSLGHLQIKDLRQKWCESLLFSRRQCRAAPAPRRATSGSPARNFSLLRGIPACRRLACDLPTCSINGKERLFRPRNPREEAAWHSECNLLFVSGPHQGPDAEEGGNAMSVSMQFTAQVNLRPH